MEHPFSAANDADTKDGVRVSRAMPFALWRPGRNAAARLHSAGEVTYRANGRSGTRPLRPITFVWPSRRLPPSNLTYVRLCLLP